MSTCRGVIADNSRCEVQPHRAGAKLSTEVRLQNAAADGLREQGFDPESLLATGAD